MKISWKLIITLALVLLIVWAYVSAPTPLPEATDTTGTATEDVLKIVASENDIASELYTDSIVGAGKDAGLKFSEHWKDEDIQAGPLPALFLREVAASIERSPIPLGLFLGSDHPIRSSNRFSGTQELAFETMKANELEPQFYLEY